MTNPERIAECSNFVSLVSMWYKSLSFQLCCTVQNYTHPKKKVVNNNSGGEKTDKLEARKKKQKRKGRTKFEFVVKNVLQAKLIYHNDEVAKSEGVGRQDNDGYRDEYGIGAMSCFYFNHKPGRRHFKNVK